MVLNSKSADWLYFYNTSFRKAAHQLLIWGYEDARSEIRADLLEEQITGLIVEAILRRLDDPSTPGMYRRYDVREEDYVRDSNGMGRKRQRLDIVIVSSRVLPRPAFVFEAKLLRKNGFPISLYAGDGGMQCFIRGEYASEYPCAAMLGYIQSDNPKRWLSELKRVFDNDTADDLKLRQYLKKSVLIDAIDSEWLSRHARDGNDEIDIYHIFLDCL